MEVMEGDDGNSTASKIVMVGNPGVGKTAFLLRYCGGGFSPFLSSTMGVDYREKLVYRWAGEGCSALSVGDHRLGIENVFCDFEGITLFIVS